MATTIERPVTGAEEHSTQLARKRKAFPKWQRIVLLAVLGYEGLGALVGGALLIAGPDGRLMAMPVEIMHGTFNNFLIPGLLLFAIGLLTTAAFASVLRRSPTGWVLAGLALGGLLIWFWIEIAILLEVHWLHYMWGLPVIAGGVALIPQIPQRVFLRSMLVCGILSSLLYVAINIIVPVQWEEYESASQMVSELSAVGAPTRTLWVILATPYTLLILGFAWGVWKCAGKSRNLRVAGALLLAYGALGLLWPFAPMHLRETLAAGGGTASDTMHIALGAATQVLYLIALGFASSALGKNFKLYSIASVFLLLLFGALTFLEAPGISKNEPTPFIGLWERINIAIFMLWVIVLALVLLRRLRGTTAVGAIAS